MELYGKRVGEESDKESGEESNEESSSDSEEELIEGAWFSIKIAAKK